MPHQAAKAQKSTDLLQETDPLDEPFAGSCRLCGHTQFKLLFEREFKLLLCRHCALIFMDEQERDYNKYYAEEYDYKLATDGAFAEETKLDQSVFNWIISHLPPTKNLTLLEVGCNAGFLLKRLKAHGLNVFGLEPGRKAVTFARQVNGLDQVTCGNLDNFAETGEKYEVIILIQTLEHLPNPLDSLLKLHHLLKRDGFLFIEVPNYYAPHGFYGLKSGEHYIPSPNHLIIYSPRTLRAFLKKAGFSIQSTSYTLLNLRVVARKREDYSRIEFENYYRVLLYFYLLPLILKGEDLLRFLKRKLNL